MHSGSQCKNYQTAPTLLQRFRYRDGQALRSTDLNEVLRVADTRRMWHNRAIHNAFGVSYGLDATPIEDAAKNLLAVAVMPGLGYDCTGAMLQVQTDQRI